MKRLTTLLAAFVLFSGIGINANAFVIQDFTLDFSVIDSDFGTYSNINNINYDSILEPNTWIFQDLGSDGVLGNGDTFTESGFMNLSSLSPGGTPFLFDTDNSLGYGANHSFYVNMYYTNLTGSISEYDDKGTTDPTDDTWNYSFDSGAGTVGWYFDNDADPSNGTISTLLTGHVIPLSSGTADGFLSGAGASSNWDVTAEIDTVNIAGFLLDEEGNELWNTLGQFNWLQTITTGDTTIVSQTYNPQANQIIYVGITGDQTVLNAVPEPSTFFLLGSGLLALGLIARRRKA
nr:PEP-CTERM sorting domain-containing protein [uncultured Desulfuromonas sp.]